VLAHKIHAAQENFPNNTEAAEKSKRSTVCLLSVMDPWPSV
jgi:hypothetical protein